MEILPLLLTILVAIWALEKYKKAGREISAVFNTYLDTGAIDGLSPIQFSLLLRNADFKLPKTDKGWDIINNEIKRRSQEGK